MYELSADATILKSLSLDIYALSVHLQLKKKKKNTEKSFNFWIKHGTWTELSRKITVWRIKMATYQQILSRL